MSSESKKMNRQILLMPCLIRKVSFADLLHLFEGVEVDGAKTQISEQSLTTGMSWETQAASITRVISKR